MDRTDAVATEPLAGIAAEVVDRFALDRLPFADQHRRMADLVDLTGRRAVVTGGGGGGLGSAIVDRLASAGADIAVLDRDLGPAGQVAAQVADRWGVATHALDVDISDWTATHRAMAAAADLLGGIDLLVNNAGGAMRTHGSFLDMTPEAIGRVVGANFLGTLYATRAALQTMLPAGSGRIVNIASEGGKTRMPRLAVYNSCKSAVLGFTRNLAEDLRGTGVTIVAVCPGVMVGPHALERMRGGSTEASREALAHTWERASIGRFSLPAEVAGVVAFLASPAGAYVHGTAVSVGGGMTD